MQKKELYLEMNNLGVSPKILDEIICDIMEINKTDLLFLDIIDNEKLKKIKKNIAQYLQGVPIEYIVQKAYFYSIPFYVNNGVLIPRNDTELMVDKALECINSKIEVSYIDVGTGSGNIGIAVYLNSKKIKNAYLVEVSQKAMEICKKNIKYHNLKTEKIKIIKSNLMDVFFDKNNHFELQKDIIITANLPYVKNNDYINMDRETFMYEPSIALFGGKNTGFEIYQKFIQQIIKMKEEDKSKNFYIFIEIGFDQNAYVRQYLNDLNLKYFVYKDCSEIDRCIQIIF